MRIAVLGLWHQGVVGSACLAEMGQRMGGGVIVVSRVAGRAGAESFGNEKNDTFNHGRTI